jgi:erythromycin esterase-like protein
MTDAELVPEIAQLFSGSRGNYDALLQLIGDARIVLLGEATHGTRVLFRARCDYETAHR